MALPEQNKEENFLRPIFKTMGKYTDDSLINSFDNKMRKKYVDP